MYSVYIIRMEGTHWWKIGIASDVDRRIAELQCGNPRPLKAHLILPAESRKHAEYIEDLMLHKFSFCRATGGSEWIETTESNLNHELRRYFAADTRGKKNGRVSRVDQSRCVDGVDRIQKGKTKTSERASGKDAMDGDGRADGRTTEAMHSNKHPKRLARAFS